MSGGGSTVLFEGVFGLSASAVAFDQLGFFCTDAKVRARLEKVLQVFVAGYNVALTDRDYAIVSKRLVDEFDAHHVGFAFEGAGMCYALFDLLAPWSRSRLRAFTDGAGQKHDYIATVGAGFAVARIPWGRWLLNRYLQNLEATVAWCVIDGYGFHQGIFHPGWFTVECRESPAALPAYARQLFDSGVGRSFWWTQGALPTRIRQTIDRFPEARRAEMWCGIGVAASYAGGVDNRVLGDLLTQSGEWSSDFLSGFPFSARMRQKGKNPSLWTNCVCTEFLKMTAEEAADLVVMEVNEIAAQLEGREREFRERGYYLLREHLRKVVTRQESRTSLSVLAGGTEEQDASQQQ
jgi:enediyne biosynthesis protein E3